MSASCFEICDMDLPRCFPSPSRALQGKTLFSAIPPAAFYRMHDPTTDNRQGPDVGTQYRSAIFYHNAEQEKEARDVTERVIKQWWTGGVATQILPAGQWWDAEEYHQLYLDNNPGGYECPSHFLRKFPTLSE